MNDDSSLRSSRVMLTAGIIICSVLAVVSIMNHGRSRSPRLLSVGPKSDDVTEANRHLSESYSEFYPESAERARFAVRTASHRTEKANPSSATVTGPRERGRVEERPNVFQKDQVVDALDIAKGEFRKSLRHFSTTRVVEKNAPAESGVSIKRSAADSGNPALASPHITVPVTVNVDNGEILSELMKIQEEVMVTRSQLDEMAAYNQKSLNESVPSFVSTPEQSDASFESDVPRGVDSNEPALAETSESSRIESNSFDAKPQVIQSTPSAAVSIEQEMSELSAVKPSAPFEVPSPEAEPEMAFELEERAESAIQSDLASESTDTEELPELDDFAMPIFGPADVTTEEELPKFDLPSQTSRTRRKASFNSYAEWIQSFEEPRDTTTVTPVSFQEEELTELPSSNELSPSLSGFDMEDDHQARFHEAAEPLIRVPGPQPAGPTTAGPTTAGPTTAVPAVPVRESSSFVEPRTIPVFPVARTSTEPVMAPPESEFSVPNGSTASRPPIASQSPAPSNLIASTQTASQQRQMQRTYEKVPPRELKAPAKNSTTSGNAEHYSANRQVTRRSGDSNSTRNSHNANVLAQRRAAAATGKPQASGQTKAETNAGGMLSGFSTVKSKLSNAVAKVPKPDLDTPRWVDRLADWKDDRFGKKNATAPQVAMPQQVIARNQTGANSSQSPVQRRVAGTPPVDRRPTTLPQDSNDLSSGRVAKSGSRPRPNVTAVPRSGSAPDQIQTARIQTARINDQQVAGVPTRTIPVQTQEAEANPVQPTRPQHIQQPNSPIVAAVGPTTPVPPRPQMIPPTQPGTRDAKTSIANASYQLNNTPQASEKVAQTSYSEAPGRYEVAPGTSPSDEFALQPGTTQRSVKQTHLQQPYASQSPSPQVTASQAYRQAMRQASESQAVPHHSASQQSARQSTVVAHTYQPAPHPNAYPATLQRYMTHSNDTEAGYQTSQRAYGKQSAVQPLQRAYRVAVSEPTEYVGTLDAFNLRMTMVIRPPSLANFGRRSASHSISNSESMTPAPSSPTLHRVRSSMQYATQPGTVR